jgi:hypothetical protein
MVRQELEHVGEGRAGSDQATLRSEYAVLRREDLQRDDGTKPREALVRAIASVRRYAPDFEPDYDDDFFARE